jgi:protoheme IX farnesyltransferase
MKASSPSLLKTYYALTKPGIIYGNALTVAGGFFLAAKGHASVGLFLATLGGACLVMASGCVFNNWLDRDIDSKMPRTKKRALVEGIVSARSALIFATVLGLIGISLLAAFTNWLTVIIGLLGLLFYVERQEIH